MAAPTVVRQQLVGDDVGAVTVQLSEAFATIRSAVLDGSPVVVVLDDRDLLGQRTVADAAVASGLLGLVRAVALEGARAGWRINAVSHRDDPAAAEEAVQALGHALALSGQLLRCGTGHIGKAAP